MPSRLASPIRENGATSGIGVLATFGYDQLGRRETLTLGNGDVTSYRYDAVSRLDRLTLDLAGTASALRAALPAQSRGESVHVLQAHPEIIPAGH